MFINLKLFFSKFSLIFLEFIIVWLFFFFSVFDNKQKILLISIDWLYTCFRKVCILKTSCYSF